MSGVKVRRRTNGTEKIGVCDACILRRIDFDFEIKIFKHGIKKEESRLYRVTKRSDVIFEEF